jgi:hypothetical protein
MSPESGRAEDVARKIKLSLEARGLASEPVGVDVVEPPVMFALQGEGIDVRDGQQLMAEARILKTATRSACSITPHEGRCRLRRAVPGAAPGAA